MQYKASTHAWTWHTETSVAFFINNAWIWLSSHRGCSWSCSKLCKGEPSLHGQTLSKLTFCHVCSEWQVRLHRRKILVYALWKKIKLGDTNFSQFLAAFGLLSSRISFYNTVNKNRNNLKNKTTLWKQASSTIGHNPVSSSPLRTKKLHKDM